MRRRQLGTTGLEISELALGTWGLAGEGYGPVAEAQQDRVIERARALGITLFETADTYARGAMERRLGRLLASDPAVQFVTKIGTDLSGSMPRKRFDRVFLEEACSRSAERFGRTQLDLVLLHNPSLAAVERGEAIGYLKEAQAAGRLRAWGVSAGSAAIAQAAISQGTKVVSLAFNAFWSRDLRDITDRVQHAGVAVLAHSVLAYGLLAGLWANDKEFAPEDHRSERWTPDELRQRLRQLEALRPLVGGSVPTLRAAALSYVLSEPLVSTAIIGPRSPIQLDQLVREAAGGPPYLSADKRRSLETRLRALGVDA